MQRYVAFLTFALNIKYHPKPTHPWNMTGKNGMPNMLLKKDYIRQIVYGRCEGGRSCCCRRKNKKLAPWLARICLG
jgi:hypothetical protein